MNKKILRLAVPNIISNITIPLLGIVDLMLMGHLDSEVYIGAIALGSMIFNFIYWSFGFLRMGTSGFTAQALGRRNFQEISNTLSRALFVAVLGSILVLILQIPIEWFSFKIISGTEEVEELASQYFYIRIWAAPATIALYSISGWFIGMQNTRFTMIIALTVNILNIIFSVIFVYVFDMKSDGVALGTVLAQYSGLVVASFLFFKYYKRFIPYISFKQIFIKSKLWQFINVNKDIFIRTLCLIFTFSFFTAKSAAANDTILAVNALLLQFLFIFSYFIDGFAHAAEAMVGKVFGAKNKVLLRKIIHSLFRWGLYIAIPFSVLFIFGGTLFLRILTDNLLIIEEAKQYLPWIYLVPIAGFAAFIWDGIYIGAISTKAIRNTMIVATFIIFLPTYYLLQNSLGNHALWLAMILFLASRGVLLSITARKSVYGSSIIA